MDRTGLDSEEADGDQPVEAPFVRLWLMTEMDPFFLGYELRFHGYNVDVVYGGGGSYYLAALPPPNSNVSTQETIQQPPLIFFSVTDGVLTAAINNEHLRMSGVQSGTGDCMNNPACKAIKSTGPIPRGTYSLLSAELSDPNFLVDLLRLGANLPSGLSDWGDWRAPLSPMAGTNTYGRSGFFLHGGLFPGSAGCIDVGRGLFGNTQTNQLQRMITSAPGGVVYVLVR